VSVARGLPAARFLSGDDTPLTIAPRQQQPGGRIAALDYSAPERNRYA